MLPRPTTRPVGPAELLVMMMMMMMLMMTMVTDRIIVREEDVQWPAWSADQSGSGGAQQDEWWHPWMQSRLYASGSDSALFYPLCYSIFISVISKLETLPTIDSPTHLTAFMDLGLIPHLVRFELIWFWTCIFLSERYALSHVTISLPYRNVWIVIKWRQPVCGWLISGVCSCPSNVGVRHGLTYEMV